MEFFLDLPLDIRAGYLLLFISVPDLINLSYTCREYRILLRSSPIWRRLLLNRFQIEYRGRYPAIIYYLLSKGVPTDLTQIEEPLLELMVHLKIRRITNISASTRILYITYTLRSGTYFSIKSRIGNDPILGLYERGVRTNLCRIYIDIPSRELPVAQITSLFENYLFSPISNPEKRYRTANERIRQILSMECAVSERSTHTDYFRENLFIRVNK